ncbi:GLPGLI family protein [Winogradskyella sp.]|uniref:GLPGLI family protein n=1 Tax=Winogradskyella sp. TaxID=1883156 RepID=UPI0025D4444C|nr:GLPGLI family protein [Winogradskyella sp.]MBT8245471.1 GLPGLI family protein [Winogradskyella sp.]
MKYLNIITLFLILSTHAQNPINGSVEYVDSFKSSTGNTISTYSLYFNNTNSVYLFMGNNTETKNNSNSGLLNFITPDKEANDPFYYKIINSQKIIYNPETTLKQYTVKDSINLNWTIHKEKKIIGNYECSKATTEFRGRKYTAWFTTKIPVDYGPRKFSGLPGLILEIYDDKGVYKAYASEIKINKYIDTEKVLNDINLQNPITHKDFLDRRCDDALEFKKIIESKMGRGSSRLKLTKVGSDENLEIDTEECLK